MLVVSSVVVTPVTMLPLTVPVKTLTSVPPIHVLPVTLASILQAVLAVAVPLPDTSGMQPAQSVKTMMNAPLVFVLPLRTASILTAHTLAHVQTDTWTKMAMVMFVSGLSSPSTTPGCQQRAPQACTSSRPTLTPLVLTAT